MELENRNRNHALVLHGFEIYMLCLLLVQKNRCITKSRTVMMLRILLISVKEAKF
jgi:hypothetical protein